jgi:hypothetical protein
MPTLERTKTILELCDKIENSRMFIDQDDEYVYDIAHRPEVRERLIKTVDYGLEFTDDFECMDVMWTCVMNYGTDDQETESDVKEECSAHSPEELADELASFHLRQKWLGNDEDVLRFIRDFSYNAYVVIDAIKGAKGISNTHGFCFT